MTTTVPLPAHLREKVAEAEANVRAALEWQRAVMETVAAALELKEGYAVVGWQDEPSVLLVEYPGDGE